MGIDCRRTFCVLLSTAGLALAVPFAAADYTISQETSVGGGSGGYHGQSFTAVDSGLLTQVDVELGEFNTCQAIDLRIYAGDQSPNDAGLALVSGWQSLASPYTGWQILVPSSPVQVDAGSQYTFELVGGTCSGAFQVSIQTSDVYAGGAGARDARARSRSVAHRAAARPGWHRNRRASAGGAHSPA